MFDNPRRLTAPVAALVLSAGAIGAAAFAIAGPVESASKGAHAPVRCVINAGASGGMISLQGLVGADAAIVGSYQFRVKNAGGGGSANISQGGDFALAAGEEAMVGQVMLGQNGAVYDARLTVTVDGETIECAERVGGAI
ncbi:curli-like amyloid fiber formation chaperone CsgH [Bauldia litoralis]|uniref:CsgH-like domain-containing protein n=1 Tax=Bauldia litoralis TaxID=665467 RepID=A0A1G6AJC7_9HYPH|nr:curli-like amyloid fiber formation chaperone CsgH [Bauldia litoralis]SDB08508.1 hypothetical protein SAMN02982931_00726 [Bauldia litoralis]